MTRKLPRKLNLGMGTWTLLVALLAVALYLPSIGFGFVYDSHPQVLIDDFLHQPRHFADVLTLRVLGMDVLDFNRPLNLLTLMVDSLLWGKDPGGYHLTNVLMYGAAAALLFRWLLALTGKFWPALLGAIFFAVHPLNCESVAEVSNREDLLVTLFTLAGLLCAMAFQPGEKGKTWLPALGTVGCFFLAVAAKESGIAGPAALGVFWLLFRLRRETAGAWLLLLAATGVACGGFLAARFALEPKHSIIFTEHPVAIATNWADMLLVQCRIWSAEFLRILWPADLCADYTGYSIRNIGIVPAFLAVGATVGLQAFIGWRNRLFALGAAVFWFSLLPVSNFIPIYHPMADRFFTLPLTGVALMLAVLLSGFNGLGDLGRFAPAAAVVAIGGLGALTVTTANREHLWSDDLLLWRDTVAHNPFSFNGWIGVGCTQLDRGQPAAALETFRHAVELTHGREASALVGVAMAADGAGLRQEASRALAAAVALDSRYAEPEKLVAALLFEPSQAQRLKVIALRSKKL